ncbi:MAG: isoleucine--tRNA ligase [Chitinophagales bacterium]|nr:isoleucine--tRNA ligase [Chitinophagales bacterium]
MRKFKESKSIRPNEIESEMLKFWMDRDIFKKSVENREGNSSFVFYEGPPSANGMPGIHHVMARTIKDLFCRYKSLKGFYVERKGGWDTHGLPVELQVEKKLGITKKDIGTKISIEDYNKECRIEVMKYKEVWDDLTQKMGYWVDLENPYITFENAYIESIWSLLKKLYEKEYLYKGLKIQPYSPAAGTGLSSHELNMPGCYREVKDLSAVAQFKLIATPNTIYSELQVLCEEGDLYMLAWTTTPWTLPSNTALAVGKRLDYVLVATVNPYTHLRVNVILAKGLLTNYFSPENENKTFDSYQNNGKNLPYKILKELKGSDLLGLRYEQLLPYVQPEEGDAFKVISGDFVTLEDGTGIVHIAPSFGADDMQVASENGIGYLTLVDKQGRFVEAVTDFAGEPVKEAYLKDDEKEEAIQKQGRNKYLSVDERIVIKLKYENKCFKSEKFEHSYPHCWRTDKPILYYPLDSWFIKVTAAKKRLVDLNNTINWKPKSTGEGRFGQWLENLVDWNLSRSRYWGTPLPIWRTEDGTEEICIGSIHELISEIERAQSLGLMGEIDLSSENLDLHKPFVDKIILASPSGLPMRREADLIDVWFDSGAMPYAQLHFPFENQEKFKSNFPADFIAEGVDQTRGWFYTLHVIATLVYDSVAYKNVISNGLVLDKNGNKMSKRLGNSVDPFETIGKYGADATRWYMISNSQPWDNLKFDIEGVEETQRKLFNTLYNTYSFFALYANLDGFKPNGAEVDLEDRPEIDKWIISCLNSLIKDVQVSMDDYEPTKATRAIQDFVNDQLSNWYVRLSRRRFWKTDDSEDKLAAYQTLHTVLKTVAQLMSPIAPFYSDWLYRNLMQADEDSDTSVHISDFPSFYLSKIDTDLEKKMDIAQRLTSLIFSLRKKENIKVRQPLTKILIPVLNEQQEEMISSVKDLILSEVNVKEIEFVSDTTGIIFKKLKPNFKVLGKKVGSKMKELNEFVQGMSQEQISTLEKNGSFDISLSDLSYTLLLEEVQVLTEDIKGWLVANDDEWTVALDITITDKLRNEGYARELVNKIQNQRKENDYNVTDRIKVTISHQNKLNNLLSSYLDYICTETLTDELIFADEELTDAKKYELNDLEVFMKIEKK